MTFGIQIKSPVTRDYIKAGTMKAMVTLVVSCVILISSEVVTNIWLSAWSDDPILNGTEGRAQTNLRLGVYGGLGAFQGKRGKLASSIAVFLFFL